MLTGYEIECNECGYGSPPDPDYVDIIGPNAADLFCPECGTKTMIRESHSELEVTRIGSN